MATLRASTVYRDGPLTVLAVASAATSGHRGIGHWHIGAVLTPIAVVVISPDGPYAVDTDGQPLDLDELCRDVVDLDALLASGA